MDRASHVVEVLVDGIPAHLGLLSYKAADVVQPGATVQVPLGKSSRRGVVVGTDGNRDRATRAIDHVLPVALHMDDVDVARAVADRHCASLNQMMRRLVPSFDVDMPLPSAAARHVVCSAEDLPVQVADRYVLRAPGVDPAQLVAAAATQLAGGDTAQVLVLCPTKKLVKAVLSWFADGAADLSEEDNWMRFATGNVRVGVGTRTAALWPAANLAGIVVAEEDQFGHMEARSPHTHARDVAVVRARHRGIPVTFTGMTPSGAALGAGVKALPVGNFPQIRTVETDVSVPGAAVAFALQHVREGRPVTVVVPDGTVSRRCRRCSTERPCPEGCHPGECEHEVARCRCGDNATFIAGIDVSRVSGRFPAGVSVITRGDPVPPSDAVVVLAADRALHRPGFEPERAMIEEVFAAADGLSVGGSVLLCVRDRKHPVAAALAESDHVGVARTIWERCRSEGLAPFGRTATVTVHCDELPVTAGLPGSVLGPIRRPSGDWELLVRFTEDDSDRFHSAFSRFRRRYSKSRLWLS